ncbi:hypothetical protein DL764_009841 [Monosporascus ibericus]|uniref:Uncharacterized protein n=1 Tax=Monosporascus ibericus TaxID=155417 RepID=A0A4Q4SU13_9PEZI|nr:hypothetical protein DL764_009841 [Monosporascus ibericus]
MNEEVEGKLAAMQRVIQLGRAARDQYNVILKTPLRTITVITDPPMTSDIESLKTYILEELTITEIIVTSNEDYGIQLEIKVDWPVLRKKLKKGGKLVRDALPRLSKRSSEAVAE